MEEIAPNQSLKKFPLVILAAGQGSRMKGSKGLLDYKGKPWLMEQVRRFSETGGESCVVVLGKDHKDYFKKISFLEKAGGQWSEIPGFEKPMKLAVVINENPERGQFSSVVLALQFLAKCKATFNWTGVLVHPVDVPLADRNTLETVGAKLKGSVKAVLPVCQGIGGHPVLLSGGFVMNLLSLQIEDPESRLDVQLRLLHGTQIERVPVDDERIFKNLNTPEEWEVFTKKN